MCAIEDGSVELVETLLKRGANIEACLDVRHPTPSLFVSFCVEQCYIVVSYDATLLHCVTLHRILSNQI